MLKYQLKNIYVYLTLKSMIMIFLGTFSRVYDIFFLLLPTFYVIYNK